MTRDRVLRVTNATDVRKASGRVGLHGAPEAVSRQTVHREPESREDVERHDEAGENEHHRQQAYDPQTHRLAVRERVERRGAADDRAGTKRGSGRQLCVHRRLASCRLAARGAGPAIDVIYRGKDGAAGLRMRCSGGAIRQVVGTASVHNRSRPRSSRGGAKLSGERWTNCYPRHLVETGLLRVESWRGWASDSSGMSTLRNDAPGRITKPGEGV